MSANGVRSRRGTVHFPCRACFIGCEPVHVHGKATYPCSNELRVWAQAHRDDPGDELGYVRERDVPLMLGFTDTHMRRAYQVGYEDARHGRKSDSGKVVRP